MGLTTESIQTAIKQIHEPMDKIGQELNELDGLLGDGDLGITLINGFNNMQEIVDDLPADVGMALFECAKAMTKVSGSSFGTLMATALMAAGKKAKGQKAVPWTDVPELIQVAKDAMIARGGAALGDKTVLDSLDAIIKATTNPESSQDASTLVSNSHIAANEALSAFKGKQCKIGRARMFGERTIGMDDPGMVAVSRMLACLDT